MLAVQRRVIDELLDQHPGQKAHVDLGVIEHAHGRCGRDQHLLAFRACCLAPDDRAQVLEHDMSAGLAGQPQARLVVDDLELIGVGTLELRARQCDLAHRHLRAKAQPRVVDLVAAAMLLAPVRRHVDDWHLLRGLG